MCSDLCNTAPSLRRLISPLFPATQQRMVQNVSNDDDIFACGLVAEWLGRWTCDQQIKSRPLHCRVQPWASC